MKKYVSYCNPDEVTDRKYYPIEHDNDWKALPRKLMINEIQYEMVIDEDANEPFRHWFPDHELNWFRKRNQIIDPAVAI